MKTVRLLIIMIIGIVLVILLAQIERLIQPPAYVATDTVRIHLEGADSVRIVQQARRGMIRPTKDMKIMPMDEYHALLEKIGLADTVHIFDTVLTDTVFDVYQSVIDTTAVLALKDSISGDLARVSVYAKTTYTLPPVDRHELILSLRGIDIQHLEKPSETPKLAQWYDVTKWSANDWKRGIAIAIGLILSAKILVR